MLADDPSNLRYRAVYLDSKLFQSNFVRTLLSHGTVDHLPYRALPLV